MIWRVSPGMQEKPFPMAGRVQRCKKGSIPEKWDGRAADRIVVELGRLLGWAAGQP